MSVPPDLRHRLQESRSLPSPRFTLDEVKQRAHRRAILRRSALAAAAVGVAALLLLSSRLLPLSEVPLADRMEPATSDPVEGPRSYFVAINEGDLERFLALWDLDAPTEAVATGPFLRDSRDSRIVTHLRGKLDFLVSLETHYESVGCERREPDASGATAAVTCEYLVSDRLLQHLGTVPVHGSIDIRVEQGAIVAALDERHEASAALESYVAWLEEERFLEYVTDCDLAAYSGSVCTQFLLENVDELLATRRTKGGG